MKRCISLVSLFLFSAYFVLAQSTARLTGTVTDPSGAAVPAAEVACRNSQTGVSYSATTNTEGLFRFPDPPIGIYELTVSASGFTPATRTGITLVTGHSVDLPIRLEVGQATQTVD